MARPGGDRIKELSNTTGTGSFVLAGAVSGEGVRAFSAAEDGQVIRYGAKHVTADEGESGYGVYTHATRTLTRLYRYFPTLGGSAVSFSAGGVHIVCSAISGDFLPNIASVDPTVNDDITTGHLQGHLWINTATPSVWYCRGHDDGAADWVQVDGAAEALSSTSFNPGSVVIDDDRQYDTYTQSGETDFIKGAGTFRRGKVVQVTFDSDASIINWSIDFVALVPGATLPTAFPDGLHTLLFSWNSHLAKIQVAWASLLLEGVTLRGHAEVVQSLGNISGSVTIDYSAGSIVTGTLTADITALAFTNMGVGKTITLILNLATHSLADPTGARWPGGSAPDLGTGEVVVSYMQQTTAPVYQAFSAGGDRS